MNGLRHKLSRQTTNAAAPNYQPSSPSGILHVFLSPGRPSTLLSLPPRTRLHASLNSRHPHPNLHRNPRAFLTFCPPPFSLRGTQPSPKALSAVALPEDYLVPLEANTPAAPSPTFSPRLQTSPENPGHEVRGSLPPAPLEVTPAWLGSEAPSWPRRPLHPPDWAGRRPRHTSPRALAQPNTGSGAAFPDPPLVSGAHRETKGRAPGPTWLGRSWPALLQDPNKARAAASRPRPGLPIGPRTLLAGGVILPQVQPVPLGHLRTLRAGGYEGRRKKRSRRLYRYSRG